MFKELRRQDRVLTNEVISQIIKKHKYGVLSLCDNDYPYGVPLHYIVNNNCLYFHCSKDGGHKIDLLKKNPKVCFTIIDTKDGIKSKSVIILGTVEEANDKRQFVLEKLIEKFTPKLAWENAKAAIPSALDNIMVFKIYCDHVSGKWIDKPAGR